MSQRGGNSMQGARQSGKSGAKIGRGLKPHSGARRDPATPGPKRTAAQAFAPQKMDAPPSLAHKRSPLFGDRVCLRRGRHRGDGDLHHRADARPHARRARRSPAQCHGACPRRRRACRAWLAARAHAAQRASALSGRGRARDRGSPLLRPFRRRSARARPRLVPQRRLRGRGRRAARPSPSSSPRTCS